MFKILLFNKNTSYKITHYLCTNKEKLLQMLQVKVSHELMNLLVSIVLINPCKLHVQIKLKKLLCVT